MIPPDSLAGLGPADIIRADALSLPLPDASVDLVITSPPYFALRSYQDGGAHYDGQIGSEATPDEFVSTLLAATREMIRVLKPSGSLWVNLGDKYAGAAPGALGASGSKTAYTRDGYRSSVGMGIPTKSLMGMPWRYALRCIDELGLILRAEVIWSKPNGLPESVTDRPRRSHEQWFMFTVSPRYFAAVDEIREPHGEPHRSTGRVENRGTRRVDGGANQGFGLNGETPREYNPLGKLPGSVREVPSAPLKVPAHLGVDHFAAFPPAWPAWIIRGWSPTGVCVDCGEGRRPVVDAEYVPAGNRQTNVRVTGMQGQGYYGKGRPGGADSKYGDAHRLTTITGYACACPTPDAPTRPAVVLDPFGGTGTTAMAARALGRHGISVDLSADYCRLARWRCTDLDELATVRGLPRANRVTETDQVSLFELLDAPG